MGAKATPLLIAHITCVKGKYFCTGISVPCSWPVTKWRLWKNYTNDYRPIIKIPRHVIHRSLAPTPLPLPHPTTIKHIDLFAFLCDKKKKVHLFLFNVLPAKLQWHIGCETIYPISQSAKIATIKLIQNHCNIVETFFRNLVFVNIPLPSIVHNPYGKKVFLLFFDKTFNPFLHQRTKVLLRKEKSLSSENNGKVRKLGTIF